MSSPIASVLEEFAFMLVSLIYWQLTGLVKRTTKGLALAMLAEELVISPCFVHVIQSLLVSTVKVLTVQLVYPVAGNTSKALIKVGLSKLTTKVKGPLET